MNHDEVREYTHSIGYPSIRTEYMKRCKTLDEKIYWTYRFIDFMISIMICDIHDYHHSVVDAMEKFTFHSKSDLKLMDMIIAINNLEQAILKSGQFDTTSKNVVERIAYMDNICIIMKSVIVAVDKLEIEAACRDYVMNALDEFELNTMRLSGILTMKLRDAEENGEG